MKKEKGTPDDEASRRDTHGQEKVERIHKNMAFAPFDAFMGIKSADSSGFFDRFHTLCIDDGRARLGILPCRSRLVSRKVVSRRNQVPWPRRLLAVAPQALGSKPTTESVSGSTAN